MIKKAVLYFAVVLALTLMVSCSGGEGNTVAPSSTGAPNLTAPPISNEGAPVERASVAQPTGNTVCLGLWNVVVDKNTGKADILSLRNSSLILNVLGFLEPPALKGMTIDFTTLNIDTVNNVVNVDVILTHPLNDPVFMGFDVKGIVFGPEVTNADGCTVALSPEFFNGVPFGYQNGLLGAPDSYANYEGLAGYKYFCDGLGLNDDLATFMSDPANLAKRGVFSNGAKLKRHFDLSWANTSPPITLLIFNYAIYANYNWPTGPAPVDISDFDITTANSAEAFCLSITETANTLYYVDGVGGGGAISLQVEAWDWQGNISDVAVESMEPGVMAKTSYSSTGAGSTAYSYVYSFFDVFATPTTVGDLDLLVTVTDSVTFGGAWFMGLLPTTNSMYNEPAYNCRPYTTTVAPCPKPIPTSVVPGSHAADNVMFSAVINGTNFIGGPALAVKLKKSGQTDIPATNLSYLSTTKISCDITIPLNAALGSWDVEVVNGCGVVGMGAGLFQVTCPAPTVTVISPNTRDANGVQFGATITGTNFTSGPSLAVALTRTGQTNINAINVVAASATQITCNITIPLGTATGQWNVRVTNGCAAQGTGANLFTVTCPTPVVTTISPNTRDANGVQYPYTITGNYFTSGTSLAVALTRTGQTDINATSVVATSATQITCNITIPIGTANGQWNVRVTNGCGGTPGVGANLLTVTCPTPVVTSINPIAHMADGVQFPVIITGSYFTSGGSLAVALTRSGSSNINATSVVAASTTQINCNIVIPNGTTLGLWNVQVTNGCGGTPGVGKDLFEVSECPSPVVDSIEPPKHDPDDIEFEATIKGSGFIDGSQLAVALTKDGEKSIDGVKPSWISSSQVTCFLTIPGGTTTGLWNVEVTNGCGGIPGVGKELFTVTSPGPSPTVTAISPRNRMPDGVGFAATVTGTDFLGGVGLNVRLKKTGQSDIIATSPVCVSSTTITCNLTIPISAATGFWDVQVTNGGGGGSGTGYNLFCVGGPKNILLWNGGRAADIAVDPKTGNVYIIYPTDNITQVGTTTNGAPIRQVWEYSRASNYETGTLWKTLSAYTTGTSTTVYPQSYSHIDIGDNGWMFAGIGRQTTSPYNRFYNVDMTSPSTEIVNGGTTGSFPYGRILVAFNTGGTYSGHHAMFTAYSSSGTTLYKTWGRSTPTAYANPTFTELTASINATRGGVDEFWPHYARGTECDKSGNYFWAVKVFSSATYGYFNWGSAFNFTGTNGATAYANRYFGTGVPGDTDDTFNSPGDLVRNVNNTMIVLDRLSDGTTFRLKAWDVSTNPGTSLGGFTLIGLNGAFSYFRGDSDNYVDPTYGNCVFIMNGVTTGSAAPYTSEYYLHVYAKAELPSSW